MLSGNQIVRVRLRIKRSLRQGIRISLETSTIAIGSLGSQTARLNRGHQSLRSEAGNGQGPENDVWLVITLNLNTHNLKHLVGMFFTITLRITNHH